MYIGNNKNITALLCGNSIVYTASALATEVGSETSGVFEFTPNNVIGVGTIVLGSNGVIGQIESASEDGTEYSIKTLLRLNNGGTVYESLVNSVAGKTGDVELEIRDIDGLRNELDGKVGLLQETTETQRNWVYSTTTLPNGYAHGVYEASKEVINGGIPLRDNGGILVATPTKPLHAVNKQYFDEKFAEMLSNENSILFTNENLSETEGSVNLLAENFEPSTPKLFDMVIGANGFMGQITSVSTNTYGNNLYIVQTKLKLTGADGNDGADGKNGVNGLDGTGIIYFDKEISSTIGETTEFVSAESLVDNAEEVVNNYLVISSNGYLGKMLYSECLITPPVLGITEGKIEYRYTIKTLLKLSGADGKRTTITFTEAVINESDWVADETIEPFGYKAAITNEEFAETSVIELLTNNATNIVKYGIILGKQEGTTIYVYAVDKPTEAITLNLGVTKYA